MNGPGLLVAPITGMGGTQQNFNKLAIPHVPPGEDHQQHSSVSSA
jgi:hypothetical protein